VVDPVRQALRISWISIGWGGISGVASIAIGAQAASLALVGSGAGVLIDLSSSAVLVWRFRHPHGHDRAERTAHVVAASALTGLAVVLAAFAILRLADGSSANPEVAAIVAASASLLVLPAIARHKYAVAAAVPSPALRADAHITMVGAATALISLAGLGATKAGFASADPWAALVVGLVAGVVGLGELRHALREQLG
jgi:divalent metal cation (Fe/Co/Zn/Cd) transporter